MRAHTGRYMHVWVVLQAILGRLSPGGYDKCQVPCGEDGLTEKEMERVAKDNGLGFKMLTSRFLVDGEPYRVWEVWRSEALANPNCKGGER